MSDQSGDDPIVTSHGDLLRLTGCASDGELVGLMRGQYGAPAGLETTAPDSVDILYSFTSDWLEYPFPLSRFWQVLEENYESNVVAVIEMESVDDDPAVTGDVDAQRLWFPLDCVIEHIEHALASTSHECDPGHLGDEAELPEEPPLLMFSSDDGVSLRSNGVDPGLVEPPMIFATTTDGLLLRGIAEPDEVSDADHELIDQRITVLHRRLNNTRLSVELLEPLVEAASLGDEFLVLQPSPTSALTFHIGTAATRSRSAEVHQVRELECIPVMPIWFRHD